MITIPNECEANCQNLTIIYKGKCSNSFESNNSSQIEDAQNKNQSNSSSSNNSNASKRQNEDAQNKNQSDRFLLKIHMASEKKKFFGKIYEHFTNN